MRKYRNVPTVVDGIRFASKAEARRYGELKLLERAGQIRNLKLQPKYELYAGIKYVADFEYERYVQVERSFGDTIGKNIRIVEDVKGVQAQAFRMKAKMFKEKYGFEITIVK